MMNKYEYDYAIHPGEFLNRALQNRGMKQLELANQINISKTIINEIIKGKRNINKTVAVSLEPIFGLPASYWLGLQNDFDIAVTKAGNTIINNDDDISISTNSAIDVAYWFVNKASVNAVEISDYLTQLKLQKLLYFAQAISLKRNNKTIFKEPLVHWEYGPVVESVWDEFKEYQKNPIKEKRKVNLDKETVIILEETYKKYGIYTAGYLVELTHKEKAWTDTNKNQPLSLILIKNTYKEII